MAKLIISGKKSYTKRMYKHLRKEHPSTRQRMILRDRIECNPKTIDYCEMCGTKMKKVVRDYRTINICKKCVEKQYR